MKKRKTALPSALAAVLAVSITTAIPANGATISVLETTAATVETSETSSTTNKIPAVGDCVSFSEETTIWSSDSKYKLVLNDSSLEVYLIGKYYPNEDDLANPKFEGSDWSNSFRVYDPRLPNPNRVLHVEIDPSVTIIWNNDGHVVGDVNDDSSVDVFDIVMLRKLLVADEIENKLERVLSDINGDAELSIADLVSLSKKIMGAE